MKDLIKPKKSGKKQVINSFCEVDCACPHVKCNKDCEGSGGPNSSSIENEDILF
jgi:hypothetical protein